MKAKTLAMHKSSSKTFDEAKESLKGKKKELFMKKMQKFEMYEQKAKEEKDKNLLEEEIQE